MIKKFIFCLFIAIGFLANNKVFATHAAGGELIYNLVQGTTSTYNFIFKFYRDCGTVGQFTSAEPATFTLCYTSPCTGVITSVTMPKIAGTIATNPPQPNGSPLNNGCNSITTCDNINSITHGYRQWWYSAQITLPQPCNAWKFWVTLCCRNDITGNITFPPGSQNFYAEVNFDNTLFQLNNSPRFTYGNSASKLPVPYVCVNSPFIHDGGGMDPDGDSLVYETIFPYDKAGCVAAAPVNILLPAFNILNTAGQPIPCTNTYNLNQANGNFDLTPSQTGYYVLCNKVSEYRNGILIGSSMRDMQIVVDNCIPLPVDTDIDTVINGTINLDTVSACPGTELQYCFQIAGDPGTVVKHVLDNAVLSLPGATISYSNPVDSLLVGCLTWTPNLSDTGYHGLLVIVKDSADCLSNPASVIFPIYVHRPLNAWGDTTMCLGDTVNISAFGNGLYNWNVAPGGDNAASILNPNTANTDVVPTTTTFYVVTDMVCDFKDTVEVIVQYGTTLTMSPDTTTCVNSSIQIGVTPDSAGTFIYSWTPVTGLDDPTLQNPTLIDPTVTTKFYVLVTPVAATSCPSIDSVEVDVLNGYSIANQDTVICIGASVNVFAGGGNPKYTYQWTPSTFVSNPNLLTPVIITPTNPGLFPQTFVASYPGCPDSIYQFLIDVQPVPNVNAGFDRFICQNDTARLEATASPLGLNYTYAWIPTADLNNPNIADPIFDGMITTFFTVTATTSAGCKDSDVVIVNVASSNFLGSLGDTSICPRESAKLLAGGAQSYIWSPGYWTDDSTAFSTLAHPTVTTDFRVVGTSAFGCTDTAYVTVIVQPEGDLELGDDKRIFPSESVRIFAEGNCSEFAWFPPNGLSATNMSAPLAQPSVTTQYIVTGKTEHGCTAIDSIIVEVVPESVVEIPNAFSPGNGTSTNDELRAIVKGSAILISFEVFNRWGQVVFSTTDINKGWNGQFNGKPQPLGSYVYAIKAKTSTGKVVTKQGNVTLIR